MFFDNDIVVLESDNLLFNIEPYTLATTDRRLMPLKFIGIIGSKFWPFNIGNIIDFLKLNRRYIDVFKTERKQVMKNVN